jgi:hypothetical protein
VKSGEVKMQKSKEKKTRAEAARLIDNLFENKNPEVSGGFGCLGLIRFGIDALKALFTIS